MSNALLDSPDKGAHLNKQCQNSSREAVQLHNSLKIQSNKSRLSTQCACYCTIGVLATVHKKCLLATVAQSVLATVP